MMFLFLSCSVSNLLSDKKLSVLNNITFVSDRDRLSNIVKKSLEKSFELYGDSKAPEELILDFKISYNVGSGNLTKSMNKISVNAEYSLIRKSDNSTLSYGSFSRKSTTSSINSLFSIEQSERNAKVRLANAVASEIEIRLIMWATENQINSP
tara:strand:- start:74 stop:532 length:459 start_codon:yes stop_codon:yes gene_type:complete